MGKVGLKIGEVAAQSGVSIDTLRYYERLGLLPKPARTGSGYRLYEARVVDRLAFIRRAQSFGFTLDEIKQLLQLETTDPQTCTRVLKMIEEKLVGLNRQYEEIKRLRHELSAYKAECERAVARGQCCPVIEDFVHPLRATHSRRQKRGQKR
jgi:DNA-binding transcriptional MerR regulator